MATKVKLIDNTISPTLAGASFTGDVNFEGSQLQYDASSNSLKFQDNIYAQFGTGDDLRIYHDGTNSYIDHATGSGDLFIRGQGDDLILRANDDIFIQPNGNDNGISVIGGSGVNIFHNGNQKFQTTSAGATVTGTLTVTGDLDITGNVNSASVTDLDVTDKTITLGVGQTEAQSGSSGIIIDGSNASLLWDETNDEFVFNKNLKSGSLQFTADTTSYNKNANISYYSSTNAVYVNGAGNDGWLRLNASGTANDRTAINLFGLNQGDLITMKTNSAERIRIDNSGNVGIGATSVDELLHLEKSSGTTLVKTEVASNSTIGFEIAKTGSTTQSWRIVDGQTVNGALEFYDLTNTTTRMIIRSGNVGIGTSNPAKKLHVNGQAQLENNLVMNENTPAIVTPNGDLRLFTGGSESMRLTSAGKLGIGTQSPYYTFDVYGTDDVTMRIHRPSSGLASTDTCGIGFSHRGDANNSTSDTRAGIFSTYNGNLFLATEPAGNLNSNPMDHSALMITGTSQRVGIGTASPDAKLTVNGAANSEQMIITGNGNQSRGLSISTRTNNGGSGGQQDAEVFLNAQDTENNAYGAVALGYAGNEVLRVQQIESSGATGAVGINEVSPAYTLDVNTTGESNAFRLYQGTSSGKDLNMLLQNQGTGSGDDSLISLYTANAAGDPKIRWAISGQETWEMGIDNSDGDKLKISNGSSLGTSDIMTFSGGKVSIGTNATIGSSATSYLVVGTGSGSATISIYTGTSGYGYLNFADGTSGAGADPGYMRYNHNDNSFYFNRSVSGPSFSSDISKKENVVDIADGWSVIKDLKPRIFDWKKDERTNDYLHGMGKGAAGFIAQEVETVLPNEVHGIDGEKGISPMGIIAHLVKTVQELEARIKELEG